GCGRKEPRVPVDRVFAAAADVLRDGDLGEGDAGPDPVRGRGRHAVEATGHEHEPAGRRVDVDGLEPLLGELGAELASRALVVAVLVDLTREVLVRNVRGGERGLDALARP